LGDGLVGEADARRVKKSEIKGLLDFYDHVSVLRLKEYWSQATGYRLNQFIDQF